MAAEQDTRPSCASGTNIILTKPCWKVQSKDLVRAAYRRSRSAKHDVLACCPELPKFISPTPATTPAAAAAVAAAGTGAVQYKYTFRMLLLLTCHVDLEYCSNDIQNNTSQLPIHAECHASLCFCSMKQESEISFVKWTLYRGEEREEIRSDEVALGKPRS